jgi:hypothetical protein
MGRLAFKRARGESEIFLDEDVYVVIGDSGGSSTVSSAWPAAGTYGPVPKDGVIGRLEEVVDSIGPELWKAKRRGQTVCLVEQCERYGPATALLWAADCVEHFAKRVYGVEGNVVEALALARRYASEHVYQAEEARALTAEIEKLLKRLRGGGLTAFGKAIAASALEVEVSTVTDSRVLHPTEVRYEADALATADQRAMQVALLHATEALCGADPLLSAREAARWCRKAAGRNELAKQARFRAGRARESSWLNLEWNPFASGTLGRSLPGQVKALKDGGDPERTWQAEQLLKYLEPSPEESP